MIRRSIPAVASVTLALLGLGGCASSSSVHTSYSVGVGYYHGDPFYDPYYYRPCCYGTVVVRPPPVHRPGGGGARPTPLPARPRPSVRR